MEALRQSERTIESKIHFKKLLGTKKEMMTMMIPFCPF
jgi:hypothetical protein